MILIPPPSPRAAPSSTVSTLPMPLGHEVDGLASQSAQQSISAKRSRVERSLGTRLRWALASATSTIRQRKRILIAPVALAVLLGGLLTWFLFLIFSRHLSGIEEDTERKAAAASAYVQHVMFHLLVPARALAVTIQDSTNWEGLQSRFQTIARETLSKRVVGDIPAGAFSTIQLAPDAVVASEFPEGSSGTVVVGLDLMDHPFEGARDAVRRTIESEQLVLHGPYRGPYREGGGRVVLVSVIRPFLGLPCGICATQVRPSSRTHAP